MRRPLKLLAAVAAILTPGAIVGAGFPRVGAVALVVVALAMFPWREIRRSPS